LGLFLGGIILQVSKIHTPMSIDTGWRRVMLIHYFGTSFMVILLGLIMILIYIKMNLDSYQSKVIDSYVLFAHHGFQWITMMYSLMSLEVRLVKVDFTLPIIALHLLIPDGFPL
jgi:hypothetical protein